MLLFSLLVQAAAIVAKTSPRPVGPNYPYLEKASGYLAEQYEAEHLKSANLQATDFIMVAALAAETSADVVSKEEERMPFGGFEIPIESEQYEHGRLYILCGIVEIKPAGSALARMDPWPQWKLICGKIFRSDAAGKFYSVRYIQPPLEDVELVEPNINSVIQAAVMDLNQLPGYQTNQGEAPTHTLAAVISVEQQVIDQKYFEMLALSKIPHDIKIYYVYFLTEDDKFSARPAVPHAAAVMFSEKTGLKLVRQISTGETGFTIIQSQVILPSMTVFDFTAKQQKKFAIGVAKAIGHQVTPADVEITDIGASSDAPALPGGISSGVGGVGGVLPGAGGRQRQRQRQQQRQRRRLDNAASAVGAVESVQSVRAEAADAGVYVTFTLSIPGSGRDITSLAGDSSFVTSLQAALTNAGMESALTTGLEFNQEVLHPNHYVPPPSGLTPQELIVLMASFVAGVLITTIRASQLRVSRGH